MAVGSPSTSSSASSLSSMASLGAMSDDAGSVKFSVVKFLCSYGGKILPRYPDGKLRYVGGDTRVLAVDRSVTFSELTKKMAEICGWGVPVSVRCQHPTEDLDALVSVTSDEDLANLLEEYDVAGRSRDSQHKIKAFLSPQNPYPMAKRGKSSPSHSPTAPRPVHIFAPPSSYPRLPVRPPAAVCYGHRLHYPQDVHHRVIHGPSSGGPGASSAYRRVILS
ncbi:RAF-like serine/threonine-protein kinase PRAF isoform X2 [Wolffia australiana]